MAYYISTEIAMPFGQAIEATEPALKQEGFGVVTRIDMQETRLALKLQRSF